MGKSKETNPSSASIIQRIITFIKNKIGNNKFIIYGHSYGGYIAKFISIKLKQQVLKLFLTCPVVKANKKDRLTEKHYNVGKITDVNIISDKNYKDFISMNVIVNDSTWHLYNDLILPGIKHSNSNFLKMLNKNYRYSEENNHNKISIPTLLVAGKQDQVVGYRDQYYDITNNYVNGSILILNNAGHNIMIDKEELVKMLFLDFLKYHEMS